MRSLNLGIVAHVDAGKTSLTERLLYAVGAIDEIGRVDDGSTQTDTLELERRRGITIKSAVVSFVVDGVRVNLIDTPGHSDFVAEVERVLSVLDGAVLVVSAVEGVQAQTRVLMRVLQRLRIPTLLFVNKIDRAGAGHARVLGEIGDRLSPAAVSLGATARLGTPDASFEPYADGDPALVTRTLEVLAEQDDPLLAAWADDEDAVPPERLRAALAARSRRALVHPVLFGSAVTGAGTGPLLAALTDLLPTVAADQGEADGPAGSVFKVERGPAGEKVAFVRMQAGTLRVRDRVALSSPGRPGRDPDKVTAIAVFDRGSAVRQDAVSAGQIARVWGLGAVRIGDVVGSRVGSDAGHLFAPPTLETVVDARRPADRGRLYAALAELAEQDPLIDLRRDPVRAEISVSLYGEVQKEVIAATLAEEYGVDVTFEETTTICVERVTGTGAAHEVIAVPPNPYLATVGLRVEPAPDGSGVGFGLEVEPGSMPPAFFTAVEQAVRETLQQGLHGWAVVDCTVTVTHSGYYARQSHAHGTFDASMSSTAGDFRNLTPLVLTTALRRAGTRVHEPMHRFDLEVPDDRLGAVLAALPGLRAVPHETEQHVSTYRLSGLVPAASVHRLQTALPPLTRGEAVLSSAFDRYAPVRGEVPERARTDHNPLDRTEYLLHVNRRV